MSADQPVLADGDPSTEALESGEGAVAGAGGDVPEGHDGSEPAEFFASGEALPPSGSVVVTDAYLGPDQTVVTQFPVHTDPALITTVDEVRSSPSYLQWQAEQDAVIGDPSDADFWFEQSTPYTCAPAVATQIVEDFTGKDLTNETDVAVYAAERGMLDRDGMLPADLATVLTENGVPSELKHDQTWEDVARYLEEGRSVVMVVDSGDYWPGYEDDSDGLDHVVRVVAIDTERGVAILSDPGHPDGQQLEVPLETLDEAWSSPNGSLGEDRMLIVSEEPDPTPDDGIPADPFAGSPDGGPAGPEPVDPFAAEPGGDAGVGEAAESGGHIFANPAGWVLVPVTLAAARIFAGVARR